MTTGTFMGAPADSLIEARNRAAGGTNPALRLHDRWVTHQPAELTPLETMTQRRRLSEKARRTYWSARLREAHSLYFPSPFEEPVRKLVKRVYGEAQARNDGDPSIAFVHGPNGSGKTTAVTRILRESYREAMPDACARKGIRPTMVDPLTMNQYCPVLPITMGNSERREGFDARILDHLGIRQAHLIREQALQVEQALVGCGVQILSVDETDKIKGTDIATTELAYRWRALASLLARETGGMLVLTANEDPRWLRDIDQTLISRLLTVEVPYMTAESTKERRVLQDFLDKAEEQFAPWFPDHQLGLRPLAGAFFHISGGQMRTLTRSICHVAVEAARRGTSVTEDMFDSFPLPMAHQNFSGSTDVKTPRRRRSR